MKKIDYSNYKKPSDFVSFDQGDNVMRIVSSGVIGYQHGTRTANRWINLGICTEDDKCENCNKGYEPKMCWKWIVFHNGSVKILDAGPMLGNQICEIANKEGDPQGYDIMVNRMGEKLKTKYSAEKAKESKDIDSEIMRSIEFKKKILINKYFK